MNLYSKYSVGLSLSDFLARYASASDRNRWQAVNAEVALTEDQKRLLARFRREMHVLILAGAWCGDCIRQCPVFEHFAAVASALKVRYVDRDEHADAQAELSINGGKRVPVAVFFSEDGHEVARYGDRTLATYRHLVQEQTGESCASGIVANGDPLLQAVTQEWLNEFERVQWMLRLSPRLRQKYGD